MKRSEMIQKLTKLFEIMQGSEDGVLLYPNEEHMAERVLMEVEQAGMLPPFNIHLYMLKWRDGEDGFKWEEE